MAVDLKISPRLPDTRDDPDEGGVRELIGTVLDSRWMISSVVLGMLVGGLLYQAIASPVYRSDTLVQVEETKRGIAGLEDLAGPLPTPRPSDSEIEILRSRRLVQEVVRKLALDVAAAPRHFPLVGAAFARTHRGDGLAPPFLGLSKFAWGGERISVDSLEVPADLENGELILVAGEGPRYSLLGQHGSTLLTGAVGAAAGEGGPVRLFISDLRARPGTQFVLTRRPTLEVVEKLQKDLSIAEKGKKTSIIRVELSGHDAGRLVRTLDELADAYRRQNIESKSEEAERTLQFISTQLPELKLRLEQAEEALNTYQSGHGTIDLPLEAKAAIERSIEIEKVATELQLQRADLAQRFTSSHPLRSALENKIGEMAAERSSTNARIKRLPASALNSTRLIRDVKVANELYSLLLHKAQELRVVKAGTIGNVRILDRAVAPREPVYPRLGQTLALALCLGLLLGVAAAVARRALNRGIGDPEVLESATGLGVYASIPHSGQQVRLSRSLKKGRLLAGGRGILSKQYPADLAVESLRSLRTNLHFALEDAPNKIVALCGPTPGTGKSFVSSNLAQVLANTGGRILLIDADLRSGSVHKSWGFDGTPGLSEVITGAMPFGEAVHREASENLDVLAHGLLPSNPSELLMSPRFRELLDLAGKEYDLVLVDTPSILAVTDAAIVARMAGVTLLVLRAGQHPLGEVMMTLKRFAQSGVRPAGLILNDIPRRGGTLGSGYKHGYHYQYDYKKKVS